MLLVSMRGDRCVTMFVALAMVLSGLQSYIGVADGSFSFDFPNFFTRTTNLLLQNSLTLGDGSLSLTDQNSTEGRVVWGSAVELVSDGATDGARHMHSFTTQFKFQIVQASINSSSVGDGLAFFLAPDPALPTHSGGMNLGIASSDTKTPTSEPDARRYLVAVEFDSFLNPDLQDVSNSHIGVDVNCLVSSNVTDTSDNPLNFHSNYTFLARIDYIASNSSLEVRLANVDVQQSQLPSSPTLQADLNLSTILLSGPRVYIGLSASAGLSTGGVLVYNWSFYVQESAQSKSSLSKAGIGGIVVTCSAAGILLLSLVVCKCRSRFMTGRNLQVEYESDAGTLESELYRIPIDNGLLDLSRLSQDACNLRRSYAEIASWTRNFHDSRRVGNGASGEVYRGSIPGQTGEVAVKNLYGPVDYQSNVERFARMFILEVETISSVPDHGNLLKLVAWCYEGPRKALLVYKYLERGDIGKYVYGNSHERKQMIADPNVRMGILLGVAKGLLHLHEHQVVHRDVKPENVLLTDDMEAVLSDFGLLRPLFSKSDRPLSTGPGGTKGFWAPEISRPGDNRHPTEKSDVYSFGVFALVIASGRPPIWLGDNSSTIYLSHWVQEESEGHEQQTQATSRHERLDSDILASIENQDRVRDQWVAVLDLGLSCVQVNPNSRPSMHDVVESLTQIAY